MDSYGRRKTKYYPIQKVLYLASPITRTKAGPTKSIYDGKKTTKAEVQQRTLSIKTLTKNDPSICFTLQHPRSVRLI